MSIRNIICALLSYVTTIKVCKSLFLCSYFFVFVTFMFIFIYIFIFCCQCSVLCFFFFFSVPSTESFSWHFLLVLGKIFIMLHLQFWPSLAKSLLFFSIGKFLTLDIVCILPINLENASNVPATKGSIFLISRKFSANKFAVTLFYFSFLILLFLC